MLVSCPYYRTGTVMLSDKFKFIIIYKENNW